MTGESQRCARHAFGVKPVRVMTAARAMEQKVRVMRRCARSSILAAAVGLTAACGVPDRDVSLANHRDAGGSGAGRDGGGSGDGGPRSGNSGSSSTAGSGGAGGSNGASGSSAACEPARFDESRFDEACFQ